MKNIKHKISVMVMKVSFLCLLICIIIQGYRQMTYAQEFYSGNEMSESIVTVDMIQTEAEEASLINIEIEKEILAAVEEEIASHLEIMIDNPEGFGIEIVDWTQLVVGTPIAVFSVSDDYQIIEINRYFVPVFEENHIAATFLLVCAEDGSFGLSSANAISPYLQVLIDTRENGEFCLMKYQGHYLVLKEGSCSSVYETDTKLYESIPETDYAYVLNQILKKYEIQPYTRECEINNEEILCQISGESDHALIESISEEVNTEIEESFASNMIQGSTPTADTSGTTASTGSKLLPCEEDWCIEQGHGASYKGVCWLAASATTLNIRFREKWIPSLSEMAFRADLDIDLSDSSTYPSPIETSTVAGIINSCIATKYTGKDYILSASRIRNNITRNFPFVLYLRAERSLNTGLFITGIHCVTAYGYRDKGETVIVYDPFQDDMVTIKRNNPVIHEPYNYNCDYTWEKTVSYK